MCVCVSERERERVYIHTCMYTFTHTHTHRYTDTQLYRCIPSGAEYSFQPLPEVGRGLDASAGAEAGAGVAAGVAAGAEVEEEEEEASISGGLVQTDCRVTFFLLLSLLLSFGFFICIWLFILL